MAHNATKHPTVHLQISENDLCGWIGQAAPGQILEYHRGFLALDTAPHGSRLPERDRAELVRMARRAWWASERALIHLVQLRHGPDNFSYLAIARCKPKTASLSLPVSSITAPVSESSSSRSARPQALRRKYAGQEWVGDL